MTEHLRYVIMYTMKSTTTPVLTVKEAVSEGIPVMLPNILDDFLMICGAEIDNLDAVTNQVDDTIRFLSYECATENDISATEAEDIIRYSLTNLGVELPC